MIGFHANKGITFDLDEIAAANPGFDPGRFTAVAGMTHQGGDYGTGDWWVFVDGVLKQSRTNAVGGVGSLVNVTLYATDRFLTLVSTDSGDGFSIDQIMFGDPLLHARLPGDFNGNLAVDAADYTVWRNNLGASDETSLMGSGDGMNGVDMADYSLWKQNYGNTNIPSAGASFASNIVPEPATHILLLTVILAGLTMLPRDQMIARP
jgi:hypothetical protein